MAIRWKDSALHAIEQQPRLEDREKKRRAADEAVRRLELEAEHTRIETACECLRLRLVKGK